MGRNEKIQMLYQIILNLKNEEDCAAFFEDLCTYKEVEKMAERAEKMQLRQDTVLQELKNVAFADGSDASGAVVKMTSKLKALELLGKHLGLFEGVGGKEPEQVKIVEDVAE